MFANLWDYITSVSGSAFSDVMSSALGISGGLVSDLASSALWLIKTPSFFLFQQVVSLLPEGGRLPAVVHDSAIYLGSSLGLVSFLLPVYDLLLILTLIFSIKITLWIFNKIQGIVSGLVPGNI